MYVMSRLIVKNLPKYLTEEALREHFAKQGEVTDAKLMKTAGGVSRKFGFVGYRTEEAADAAMKHFNKTFINMSRIIVEKAIPYGDSSLPRPWSKYSEGSSAHEKLVGPEKKNQEFAVEETDAYKEQQRKKDEHINKLKAVENDPKLKEFLDVMSSRSKSKTWANDDTAPSDISGQTQGNELTEAVIASLADSDDDLYEDLPAKKTTVNTTEDVDMEDAQLQENHEDDLEHSMKRTALQNEESENQSNKPANTRELIEDTGRLFVRNLSYFCTEDDLRNLFSKYGTLSEVHMPISRDTKQSKGYAYILYLLPEHAIRAYEDLDMKTFQGRLLHILPAKEKPPTKEEELFGPNGTKLSSVKKEKEKKRKNLAGNDFNWNSLYMSSDAIAESIADRLGVAKSDVLNAEADNMAVRLALAETQIITETKEFFEKHGIVLDTFGKKARSETVILVKNFPYGTSEEELRDLFGKYGDLGRVLIPPAKTIAVVEFMEPTEARNAFKALAYRRFKDTLIYLEKAPSGIFRDKVGSASIKKKPEEQVKTVVSAADIIENTDINDHDADVATLFVKNLNFSTTPKGLRDVFSSLEGYRSSRINVRPDSKNPNKKISMGYGFVEFNSVDNANKALKAMQGYNLDGHALSIKFSNKGADNKKKSATEADTTKLVVRNVPFEATAKDLRELFSTYGQLKSLRLPKKFNGGHRGFAFLDFMTKQEAKNVYESMANIHLYGRHLVLEWAQEDDGVEALRQKTGKNFAKEENISGRVNKRRKVDLDGAEDDEMLE
ncbi:Multiple RNA-binding domain-containing protein 1 [Apophysomyces ossiformis]|uniref:Multiple RNA-binding domain-containing protein 1 n=1 Tax=Apophysomyces ossiformis TaxID=679940 RepID=A0A8H7BL39_9FUNG|nr:Multiple RNA-binding domain-containing protein 1 [Apophysomyces ossiformis]